jgi:hypothetical protein
MRPIQGNNWGGVNVIPGRGAEQTIRLPKFRGFG